MKTKHTPHPWRPVTQFDTTGEAHHYVDTLSGDTVAICFTEQDARLISVAPKLLDLADMLDDLLLLLDSGNRPDVIEKKIRQYGQAARAYRTEAGS